MAVQRAADDDEHDARPLRRGVFRTLRAIVNPPPVPRETQHDTQHLAQHETHDGPRLIVTHPNIKALEDVMQLIIDTSPELAESSNSLKK